MGGSADISGELRRGAAALRKGRLPDAEGALRRVLAAEPGNPAALHLLGLLLHRNGRRPEGLELVRRSVEAAPAVAEFRNNLGSMLGDCGQAAAAAAEFSRAAALSPGHAASHANLGLALSRLGKLGEAVSAMRRAITLDPGLVKIRLSLGDLQMLLGDVDEAVATYREAMRLDPTNAAAHSAMLYALQHREMPAQELFEHHLAWARLHAAHVAPEVRPGTRSTQSTRYQVFDPGRCLRVGYVSAGFCEHPLSLVLEPLLAAHDPRQVEVFCYSDARQSDSVTARMRSRASGWRNIRGFGDDEVEALVRGDRVDILVDAAGHEACHRLTLFARKPAPLQVTYAAYPYSTGLRTMDYLITDAEQNPPGLTERYHTERLVRLPVTARLYRRADDPMPLPASAPPSDAHGFVTFGLFNRLCKITPRMTAAWSDLLGRLPDARLLVLAPEGSGDRLLESLSRHGIEPARVQLRRRRAGADYLRLFDEVDVALDTYPFNGCTTTCDALWMGVPVVTLAGDAQVSRAGSTILHAVGLGRYVARSVAEYLDLALALASDFPLRRAMRQSLRGAMERSPLMDAPRLAAALEAAYRQMWIEWCGQR